MKLTIESMMYGPDGLAHAEDGKAVFVAGGVAGKPAFLAQTYRQV